jgi:hypothetical protein
MDDHPPFYYYDPDAPKPPKRPPARRAWSVRSTRTHLGCLGCLIPTVFLVLSSTAISVLPKGAPQELPIKICGGLFFAGLFLNKPAAYLLTMRLVTHLRCPDCDHHPSCWDAWECGCGLKSRRVRHVMEPCERCRGWVSYVHCERCGSSVEVWGDPPHEEKEGTWVGRTASASNT